jgi:hypothetical protein
MPKMSLNDLSKKINIEHEARTSLESRVKLLGTGVVVSLTVNVFLLSFVISQLALG